MILLEILVWTFLSVGLVPPALMIIMEIIVAIAGSKPE